MAKFTDVLSSMIHYGKNNFIEVTKTEVEDDEGTNVFIGVKKGFLSEDGRNYKGNIPVPMTEDAPQKIAASILSIAGVDEFDYQKWQEEIEVEE